MTIRAAIFDIYGTLLEFGPPSADAPARWAAAWRAALGGPPRLSLEEFNAACRAAIALEHAPARAGGIAYPETYWPDIVDAILPEFAALPARVRTGSPIYGADLLHTVRLLPGAAAGLRAAQRGVPHLGLASNCQPYTLAELDAALAGAGLDRSLFDPRLTFLSFENGFSKPDPHVFRLLTARLRALGVAPAEVLMVGDREDNDLAPARAQGWRAARIGADARADWRQLEDLLSSSRP